MNQPAPNRNDRTLWEIDTDDPEKLLALHIFPEQPTQFAPFPDLGDQETQTLSSSDSLNLDSLDQSFWGTTTIDFDSFIEYQDNYWDPVYPPQLAAAHMITPPVPEEFPIPNSIKQDAPNLSLVFVKLPNDKEEISELSAPSLSLATTDLAQTAKHSSPRDSSPELQSPSTSGSRSPDRSPGIKCVWPSCSKIFSRMSVYNHHCKNHTRPFQCPSCPLRHPTKRQLKRHINDRHCATEKYYCIVDGCSRSGKAFLRTENYRRHLKKVHRFDDRRVKDGEIDGDCVGVQKGR